MYTTVPDVILSVCRVGLYKEMIRECLFAWNLIFSLARLGHTANHQNIQPRSRHMIVNDNMYVATCEAYRQSSVFFTHM